MEFLHALTGLDVVRRIALRVLLLCPLGLLMGMPFPLASVRFIAENPGWYPGLGGRWHFVGPGFSAGGHDVHKPRLYGGFLR